MFRKDLTVPIALLQVEAAERRIIENHIMMPEIKKKIKILRSGYNGEKTIKHYLEQIPDNKYHIFHGLRFPVGNTFFQIDALLLSPKIILMFEGKNHSGILRIGKNQMIHENGDIREVYENPVSQAIRHKILLKNLLESNHTPKVPIGFFIAVCRTSTEVIIESGYREAEEKICRAYDILHRIDLTEKYFKEEIFNKKQIEKVSQLLLTKHTPESSNILKQIGINKSDIRTGVQCPICFFIPMIYDRQKWTCPNCQCISKEAFLQAIYDYFLLIDPHITNQQLCWFLNLPTPRSASYLFSLLKFPYTGNSRDRIYHQPHPFP
ncbi:nuclease-related domain-containing protein [Paenibacillus sp. BSR1-1]|uniref:nuclease-related domain-containing protein n=1 Tax=Paenibacillus sp. BSR1-1 TaxID=3020845 RepID=UPI0025B13AC5|nr:nuclease-related domain-containing protein [Paenibacillus sp. BSR1-1]MDN3017641.1 nuclease-related domain-containing protein [Paenibacillus sp. BSR1-1]